MTIPKNHAEIPEIHRHECPYLACDVIIEFDDGYIMLVDRKYPPLGLAIPGGHVDYGESVEDAARREMLEETGLNVELVELLGIFSKPDRDPRKHVATASYIGRVPEGTKKEDAVAGDDAANVVFVHINDLIDQEFAFDHGKIMQHYMEWRLAGGRPKPC